MSKIIDIKIAINMLNPDLYLHKLISTKPTIDTIVYNAGEDNELSLLYDGDRPYLINKSGNRFDVDVSYLEALTDKIDPNYTILLTMVALRYADAIELSDLDVVDYINVICQTVEFLSTADKRDGGIDVTNCEVPFITETLTVLSEVNHHNLIERLQRTSNVMVVHRDESANVYIARHNYADEIEYLSLNSVYSLKQGSAITLHELIVFDKAYNFINTFDSHVGHVAVEMVNLFSALVYLRAKSYLFK